MLDVVSVFEDSKLRVGESENGYFSIPKYNRFSRLAELRLIDWLSGDTAGQQPPEPYLTQKNADWLAPFVKKLKTHAENGFITRPDDYYRHDNLYRLGSLVTGDCDEDATPDECNTSIEVLSGAKFNMRCNSWIKSERPSMIKPIAKQVGKTFEFAPSDIGSLGLEYVRYPIFGSVVQAKDDEFNDIVADTVLSTNYEWDENARELLVYFIVDYFSNSTREQALKQFNNATQKTIRG